MKNELAVYAQLDRFYRITQSFIYSLLFNNVAASVIQMEPNELCTQPNKSREVASFYLSSSHVLQLSCILSSLCQNRKSDGCVFLSYYFLSAR